MALLKFFCQYICPAFLLVQIPFVCGCAATPKRPYQILALSSTDETLMSRSRLAGCYADKGKAFNAKGQNLGQVSLSHLLFGEAPDVADTVTVLDPKPDVIDIRSSKKR